MKYIKNVVSREALDLGALAERPRPEKDKKAFREQLTKSSADWVLYSMVEGKDPNTRASQTNPAARLLGFIADFLSGSAQPKRSRPKVEGSTSFGSSMSQSKSMSTQ